MTWTLHEGDALTVLPTLAADSVDAVVCDPPYDLTGVSRGGSPRQNDLSTPFGRTRLGSDRGGFTNKSWDGTGVAFRPETWAAVLRVAKSGAWMLCAGSPRTYHRLACAVEDAGWIITDCLHHIHSQGFPKAASTLKPAYEPWLLCRKPAPRVLPLQIDASRIPTNGEQMGDPTRWDSAFQRKSEGWHRAAHVEHADEYAQRRAAAPTKAQTSGRWPTNAVFSHTPDCVLVGVRRVKATRGSVAGTEPGMAGGNHFQGLGRVPFTAYADPDGCEEIADWRCAPGGQIIAPCFSYRNGDASPLTSPACLLDRLQSLLQEAQSYSTTCSSLLHHAAVFGHSERTQSADSWGGPAYEAAHALGMTALLGSLADCPTCRRFCDEHVHHIREAVRAGVPSLLDALAAVHSALRQRQYSLVSLDGAHPSSSGDLVPSDACLHIPMSRTSGASRGSELSDEIPSDTQGTPAQGSPLSALRDSTPMNNSAASGSHEMCLDNGCTSDAVRLLCLLGFDLAFYFLPAVIIQRGEIVINLPSCPIATLDAQAGERPSSAVLDTPRFYPDYAPGDLFPSVSRCKSSGYGATGSASRFYPTFKYQPKASRSEREYGLLGVLPCMDCGGIDTLTHLDKKGNEQHCRRNSHPTVKPATGLMDWLCTLVTPPGGTILDPFAGSGSTGCAASRLGFHFIGIEREPEYAAICRARLAATQPALEGTG